MSGAAGPAPGRRWAATLAVAELLAVAAQTMQPTRASLWLRPSVGAAHDQRGTGGPGAAARPAAASPPARTPS